MHLINQLIGMYRIAVDQYEYDSNVELDDITIDLTLGKFHQLVDEAAANDICVFTKIRESDGLKIFELCGIPTTCVELTDMDNASMGSYKIQIKPRLQ